MIKVSNIISSKSGREVSNQFIIDDGESVYFQSYSSIIAKIYCGDVFLNEKYWNYSRTTSKYRNIFLSDDTKSTKNKIKSGEYKLTNLNK